MSVILGKDGFIFDCRFSNEQNKIGVLESFKSLLRGDIYNVDIICGLSINGSLLIPAYLNLGRLFTPLTSYVTSGEDLDVAINRFIRSNKPTFSDVTNEEMAEFSEVCKWFEEKTSQLYGAEKWNYCAMMMKDEFVHFHAVPRYSNPVNAYGF